MPNKIVGRYEVKQVGAESDRTLRFIGTTETPDRDGDIIKADGWKLDNYLKNPVFLGFHNYYSVPLGKCVNISRQIDSLTFDIKFASIEELSSNPECPSDEAQDADTVYMAYKNGYMNAVSVGFIGQESQERDDQDELPTWQRGRIFTSQELLELSAVAVPSNPNALQLARTAKTLNPSGIDRLEKLFSEHKGAIPYKKYPLAEEDLGWNVGEIVKEADTDDLKIICAWYDSDNSDVKSSYKLPHHLGSADGHKTVWHGVAAAMGALLGAQGGVNIPDSDRKAVFNHLSKHYLEFEKTVPDFKFYTDSEWKLFCQKSEKKNMEKEFIATVTIDPNQLTKSIMEATEPLLERMKALESSRIKTGAKLSASTKQAMQECYDHMTKGYESVANGMAKLKGLMDGDDSEPDGQSTSENRPQTDIDGNVDAPEKNIDLEKLDTKYFRVSGTETTGGQGK